MIPPQILKKVKRIEITSRGLVNNLFGGEYHSVFKGRGMTFSEVREYQPGDDIRLIDWNVTARTNSPFIKDFRSTKLEKNLKINGMEYLDEIKKNQKPVIFVSGHFNNFELMAMQIEKSGINLAAVYLSLIHI